MALIEPGMISALGISLSNFYGYTQDLIEAARLTV
jgi:hypothetical protein